MNKLLFLLGISAILFSFSCDDDEDMMMSGPNIEDVPLGTFRLTVDGETQDITDITTEIGLRSNGDPASVTLAGNVESAANTGLSYFLTLSTIQGQDLAAGSFTSAGTGVECFEPDGACNYLFLRYIDLVAPANNRAQTSLSGQGALDVDIVEINAVSGGIVRGTFEGTLRGNQESVTVTEGVFHLELD